MKIRAKSSDFPKEFLLKCLQDLDVGFNCRASNFRFVGPALPENSCVDQTFNLQTDLQMGPNELTELCKNESKQLLFV